jgi:hypothetical protein
MVLRRQISRACDPVVDRVWLAVVFRLLPRRRWAAVFAVTPAMILAGHPRLVSGTGDYTPTLPAWASIDHSGDHEAGAWHGEGESHLGVSKGAG